MKEIQYEIVKEIAVLSASDSCCFYCGDTDTTNYGHFQTASHEERNNVLHLPRRNQQARLHKEHFLLICSSSRLPEEATDDRILASEAEAHF